MPNEPVSRAQGRREAWLRINAEPVNVPAFTFQRTPEGFRCGVQDANHGTYSDLFTNLTEGARWVEDLLVAYFGRTSTRAADEVREAADAAMRAGMLDLDGKPWWT